ncbi:MAG TPA: protein kinase, partial [Gemmatimonadales bacterium]|nr:protein kinase [Gemmatimonadales bacterium]
MADLRAALGHALGPAYRVEREVRPVGSCRMFVALDQAAGTELLVKVLPTPLSLSVDHVKFEAELAALAARLAHRGLVTPLGGGRAGSFVYHTRRFVQGTTLRAALARQGELPLRRAVEVLHDLLDALAHAHGAGIWHGDLKPENVLLADGQTLVSDAGVFSAVENSWGGGAG